MKLIIKVGGATIEIEGKKLTTTKIVAGTTPVEITEESTDKELKELTDKLSGAILRITDLCAPRKGGGNVRTSPKKAE